MKKLFYLGIPIVVLSLSLRTSAVQQTSIETQLLGDWQNESLEKLNSLMMRFKSDQKLVMIFGSGFGTGTSAMQFDYKINSSTQPMQIDLKANESKIETIFELLPNGKLNLQTDKAAPGKPRPIAFEPNGTITFLRVDPQAKLPSATNPDQEAIQILMQLAHSHFLYRFDQGKFAEVFDPSGLKIPTETENYQFQVLSQPNSIQFKGRAKRPDLRHYIGAVFQTTDERGILTLVSGICAGSDKNPPPMPQLDESFPTTVCLKD